MKSNIFYPEDDVLDYPYLGYDELQGVVVLFTNEGKGMVVYTGNDSVYHIGDYGDFYEDSFEVFKGTITLSNE